MNKPPERIWAFEEGRMWRYNFWQKITHPMAVEYIRADVHERLMENMRQIEANVQKVREHEHQRANKAEAIAESIRALKREKDDG